MDKIIPVDILKHGAKYSYEDQAKFVCKYCKCEFYAKSEEVFLDQYDGCANYYAGGSLYDYPDATIHVYKCQCPECNSMLYSFKIYPNNTEED